MLISKVVCSFYSICFPHSSFLLLYHIHLSFFFFTPPASLPALPQTKDKTTQFLCYCTVFCFNFGYDWVFTWTSQLNLSHNQMTTLFMRSIVIEWLPYLKLITHVFFEPFSKMRYATFLLSFLPIKVLFMRKWVLLTNTFLPWFSSKTFRDRVLYCSLYKHIASNYLMFWYGSKKKKISLWYYTICLKFPLFLL